MQNYLPFSKEFVYASASSGVGFYLSIFKIILLILSNLTFRLALTATENQVYSFYVND
jgi:hypothetical protein